MCVHVYVGVCWPMCVHGHLYVCTCVLAYLSLHMCMYGQVCTAECLEVCSSALSVVIASGRHHGDFISALEFALFKGPIAHFHFKTR